MLAPLIYVSAFAAQRDPVRPITDVGAKESYVVAAGIRRYAACDCGWEGKRRWFRSSATHDAVLHFVDTRHQFMC